MDIGNPYGDIVAQESKTGSVVASESRAIAEVKAQVFMARQYPRDPIQAVDRILLECDRQTLAEKAIYSFPRGDSTVSGASIHLARAIIRAWGNAMSGVVEVDRDEKSSSMLAYAWDMETNTMRRAEFKVPHSRDTKNGKKPLKDDRDIYEMTANMGARRERSCILALIPGDVVDAAVERCEKTLVAKVGDMEEFKRKLLEKYAKINVTKGLIEKRLRHKIETLQPSEAIQLKNIYNAIYEGQADPADYFDMANYAEGAEAIKAKMDAKKNAPSTPTQAPEPTPKAPPSASDDIDAAADAGFEAEPELPIY